MCEVSGCAAGGATMTAKGMAGLPAGPADKRRAADGAVAPELAPAPQTGSTAAQLQGTAVAEPARLPRSSLLISTASGFTHTC